MKTNNSPRWMVVDDDEGLRMLVGCALEGMGRAEVCGFDCGADALAAFAADPDGFQFVVTDFQMPGMDGLELRRRLHEIAPGLKILLATGSGAFTDEEVAREGFCGLLSKPFTIDALREAVEAAVAVRAEVHADADAGSDWRADGVAVRGLTLAAA